MLHPEDRKEKSFPKITFLLFLKLMWNGQRACKVGPQSQFLACALPHRPPRNTKKIIATQLFFDPIANLLSTFPHKNNHIFEFARF